MANVEKSETKNIAAIFAHPDDAEQFAGGTLALLAGRGHRVTILALSGGECGSRTLSPEEIKKVRMQEGIRGARRLGATYKNLGLRDGTIIEDSQTRGLVVDAIREIKPDIVIAQNPYDYYMSDHADTGKLVLHAVPEARHPNYPLAKGEALVVRPYLYFADPQGLADKNGQIPPVNTLVNVDSTIDQALEAFLEHRSQIDLKTLEEAKETKAWKRGRAVQLRNRGIKVDFVEGFTQRKDARYPIDNILAELLPGLVYSLG